MLYLTAGSNRTPAWQRMTQKSRRRLKRLLSSAYLCSCTRRGRNRDSGNEASLPTVCNRNYGYASRGSEPCDAITVDRDGRQTSHAIMHILSKHACIHRYGSHPKPTRQLSHTHEHAILQAHARTSLGTTMRMSASQRVAGPHTRGARMRPPRSIRHIQ